MPVFYEKRNHVGWLTLSRPEARNAWGDDFNEEIARHCGEMVSDPETRIGRPRQLYVGRGKRDYVPVSKR